MVGHVLVATDVLLEGFDRKRSGKADRRTPDRLHPQGDDLREGVDVLVPRPVEVALEEEVRVIELLTLAVVTVGEPPDHRPAGVMDERQDLELLQREREVATRPEDDPEQNRPAPPDRSEHRDRGGLALDVRHAESVVHRSDVDQSPPAAPGGRRRRHDAPNRGGPRQAGGRPVRRRGRPGSRSAWRRPRGFRRAAAGRSGCRERPRRSASRAWSPRRSAPSGRASASGCARGPWPRVGAGGSRRRRRARSTSPTDAVVGLADTPRTRSLTTTRLP